MRSYTTEELLALVIEYKKRPEAAWYTGSPKDFVKWIEQKSHTALIYSGIIPTSPIGTST